MIERATEPQEEQLDIFDALDEDEGLDEWVRSLPCPPWAPLEDEAA